jgi:hypothetical protein
MFYSNLMSKLTSKGKFSRNRRPKAAPPRRSLRPSLLRLETLEDRRLLSTGTTTTLQGYPSTAEYGQPAVLVAKVVTTPASTPGSGPTGTVSFYLNSTSGTLLGTANLNQRGVAVLSNESAPLPVTTGGTTDTILAVYSGDSNFSGSQASAVETVNPASTRTVVYASPNPGVAGASETFTAIVTGVAPRSGDNGGQITPPTGTVTFTVNGTQVPSGSVTFVGDSGNSAVYTYTTSSLTAGSNSVSASYGGDGNYLASSSQTVNFQVVAAGDAGSGTVTAGSSTSPLSLRGGQTFSISYDSSSSTPGTVTYTDTSNGNNINLTGTISQVVFSSNGDEAEITGTGTNTSGSGASATTTDVNFTLFVSTQTSGWWRRPNFSISIVGSDSQSGLTGTGLNYNHSGSLASGNTVTIDQTGTSTATIPPEGGLPGAHDEVFGAWPGEGWGEGGGGGRGFGGGFGHNFGASFGRFWHARRG